MDTKKILESLSPNELKVLANIGEKDVNEICKKSNLDKVSVVRSLEYLKNKGIIELNYSKKEIVELGNNGVLYKKKGLPERRLLDILSEARIIPIVDAQKQSKLSDDELKISIGALKKKAMIELNRENILLSSGKEEVSKKMLEELFLESLPVEYDSLTPEQIYAFKNLQKRKDILHKTTKTIIKFNLTSLGREASKIGLQKIDLIEQVTPDIIKDEKLWKGKKFRRYDIISQIPEVYGGKRHFVNQAIDYGRKIWIEMGFREMKGDFVQSSFWNFDALFTAQDHPVREMQDTFFISQKSELPEKEIAESVKKAHETGIDGSKGWRYKWDEKESRRSVLRTHTTCLSAQTLAQLKKEELPAKFFAIGKCFRNETIDWSHGFEFNQTEGIVIDRNANFRHLLGYLKQFFNKMGFEKIRFSPAYFPYTEPSVEINVWHPEKKVWLELGGAGIFRPEVVIPLLGENVPVLAWGPGFDRALMDYYNIKDLRELYKNNLTQLRKVKFWMK